LHIYEYISQTAFNDFLIKKHFLAYKMAASTL